MRSPTQGWGAGRRGQGRRCQPGDPSWCLLVHILGKIPLRGPCPPLQPLLPLPRPLGLACPTCRTRWCLPLSVSAHGDGAVPPGRCLLRNPQTRLPNPWCGAVPRDGVCALPHSPMWRAGWGQREGDVSFGSPRWHPGPLGMEASGGAGTPLGIWGWVWAAGPGAPAPPRAAPAPWPLLFPPERGRGAATSCSPRSISSAL